MLKIAHFSDIHAGYRAARHLGPQGVNLREMDGYLALSQMVTDCISRKPDLVVIAGDTFHTSTPAVRTVVFVQAQLRRLAQAGIPVYILAGNHDTDDIRANIAASRVLDDPSRGIFSHAEPYVKHEVADGVVLHLVSHHVYMDQKQTMKQVAPVDGCLNILSTHGSVIDPLLRIKLHTEQSPREVVIPDHLMAPGMWDYVLLGHIHERGWVGSDDQVSDTYGSKVFYNGSLIRRGFADKPCRLGRGWTLWTVDSDGTFTSETLRVAQRPQYDFDPLDASGMSASEVTGVVVDRLRSTQPEQGAVFQPASAPIIRQRIENLTAGKKAALDMKAIDAASAHALHWDMPVQLSVSAGRQRRKADGRDLGGSDMVQLYDEWVEDCGVLGEVEPEMREVVVRKAREFVKAGQQEVLDAE